MITTAADNATPSLGDATREYDAATKAVDKAKWNLVLIRSDANGEALGASEKAQVVSVAEQELEAARERHQKAREEYNTALEEYNRMQKYFICFS